jgi:hypothetical protein
MKLLLWEEFRKILERINPLSPPSAPVQRRLQGPPAKRKFLAVANPLRRDEQRRSAVELPRVVWLIEMN